MQLLSPQSQEQVLDAGCGSGFYTELLLQVGSHPVGLDAVPAMTKAYRSHTRAPIVTADLLHPPFRPVFDRIVCAGALEFTSDPNGVVRALTELLRIDGPSVLVLHFPADNLAGRLYRHYHARHGISIKLFSKDQCNTLTKHLLGFSVDAHYQHLFNHVLRLKRDIT